MNGIVPLPQQAVAAQPNTFQVNHTQGHVLCCLCGVPILSNPTNMCVNCLRTQVDITDGIQKQVTILYCKECGKYLQPPKHWLLAELESKELLTFCIKRIKGLQKVKLIDAKFIWTEPHSKRIKLQLTIQKEVMNGAIMQQTFPVEFVVEWNMCPHCQRTNANPNSWKASVQVRQHVEHKRTFMFLEQLILKHNAQEQCVNIKNIHEGVDFYFGNRAHGSKFVDFLQSVVPVRFRNDKQLVSHDTHSNTYNFKYTFSVEIVPICKDDLIFLPAKVAAGYGGLGPVVLCTRVTNALQLLDPTTLRSVYVDAPTYWRQPYRPLMTGKQLVKYVVLDMDCGRTQQDGKLALAEVQVARESDLGNNDITFFARTHLGNILHVGDVVLGYDLANANVVDPEADKYIQRGSHLPDVVLVRKSYEDKRQQRRSRGKQRPWKLRKLAMEVDETEDERQKASKAAAANRSAAADRERFLEELEEDPDMRARVAIYKDPTVNPMQLAAARNDEMSDDEGDLPEVPLEELLDDLEALQIDAEDGAGDSDHEMMEH